MKSETNGQKPMIGRLVINKASGTSRSSKVNDRERRALKRRSRMMFTLDVKAGRFSRVVK